MNVTRDYGYVNGGSIPNNSFNVTSLGQVYEATHGGDGKRLPYMNRSFISFTYGGKPIEDFNLIATIDNNSLNRLGYTSFNDLTTTYDVIDGLQFWGTHFTNNTLLLTLSTDGMDLKLLDEFLHWFVPGEAKELILAEHPNRAQLARISEPPQIQMLPFETNVTMLVSGREYYTKTTLYKGNITLKLIMDEPHWYALDNILGRKDGDRYVDEWKGPNDTSYINIFSSQDALKILYEDGIPLGSMIEDNMMLGNSSYAAILTDISLCIWDPDYNETEVPHIGEPATGGGACILGTVEGITYKGSIAGAIIKADGSGVEALARGEKAYFFYAGTAPAPARLTFTFTPIISGASATLRYITTPKNSITNENAPYNTITIKSTSTLVLQFTTPNLLTSYNKAIKILKENVSSNNDWEDIRERMREEVRHPEVRKWAIRVIDYAKAKNVNNSTALRLCMSYFLKDVSGNVYPMTCIFDSKTGEATGYFRYRYLLPGDDIPEDATAWETYGNYFENEEHIIEDIGDMMHSNYLIIKDRNYPNANGHVVRYTESHKEYSHLIEHDFNTPLTNLLIEYKNMYL